MLCSPKSYTQDIFPIMLVVPVSSTFYKHPDKYNTQTALVGVSAILFCSLGPCYYYTSDIWIID